jgi:hypothetical protein
VVTPVVTDGGHPSPKVRTVLSKTLTSNVDEPPPAELPKQVRDQLIESFESQAQTLALVVIADVLAVALALNGRWPNGVGEWVGAILAGVFGAAAIFAYFFAPYLARRWLRERLDPSPALPADAFSSSASRRRRKPGSSAPGGRTFGPLPLDRWPLSQATARSLPRPPSSGVNTCAPPRLAHRGFH